MQETGGQLRLVSPPFPSVPPPPLPPLLLLPPLLPPPPLLPVLLASLAARFEAALPLP